MLNLWRRYRTSSIQLKIVLFSTLAVWALALGGVAALVWFAWERPSSAQPPAPAEFSFSQPGISLEPSDGLAGTEITVSGQHWSPGSLVLLYLNPANAQPDFDFARQSAVADADRCNQR